MIRNRKSLAEILRNDARENLTRAWSETQAAEDFAPLPEGEYSAKIVSGELFNSREKNTPGFKICFEVLEGDHRRRKFWHDLWLTEAALPMAKRDLAKIGVLSLDQLDSPLPPGIRCAVKVVLRRDDDGFQHNRVQTFSVLGIDPPVVDPFAPPELKGQDPPPTAAGDTP